MVKMTYNQYIQNPMGGSFFTQREMFRALYTEKLNKILVRETGRVKYFLYKDGERYLVHVKVPSEVIEKFYYDTVIEFYTDNPNTKLSNQLDDYFVRFYSNDPAFVYTFAYSFLKNGIFIKDLVPRMSKKAVEEAAKIKNPKNIVGYVKSIYFAYLIIKNYGLMKKINFDTYGKPFKLKEVLASIEHADLKVLKRKEADELLNKKKKIEKKKEQQIEQSNPTKKTKPSNSIASTHKAAITKVAKRVTSIVKRK